MPPRCLISHRLTSSIQYRGLLPSSSSALRWSGRRNTDSYTSHRNQSTSSTVSWPLDPHPPNTTPLPLHGIRILDLSRVLAGPFCTQILADYGASVLKVEQPVVGDETRQWRTHGETAQFWKDNETGSSAMPTMSLYYASINRNKRSMTLNLKAPAALPILQSLIREADVLVHNFLPSRAEALGLGYEAVKKVNPRLIYASVSGYGGTGPKANRAGYDAIALAEAGLLHITGNKDSGPTKPGVAIADLCTGLYAHGAILAGLRQRDADGVGGRGCKVDGSLFETGLSLLINVGLASLNLDLAKGKEGRRTGGRFGLGHAALVPYGGFETGENSIEGGTGRMMFIAANNNRQWKRLCEVMGAEQLLQEERFSTNDGRVENRDEINGLIGARFKKKSLKEWLAVFEGSGLPYGPINNVVEALEDEQSLARGMVVDIDDFEAAKDGVLKTIGPAVKFEGANMSVRRKPPTLGEHTDEVLSGLGFTGATIEELRRENVV